MNHRHRLLRLPTFILTVITLILAAGLLFTPHVSFAGTATSRFVVFHASPDAPNVDVYANGELIAPNLPYDYFTGVFTAPSGDYHIQVYAAGANPKQDKPVIDQRVMLEPEKAYTLIAAGNVADLSLLVIEEPARPKRGDANVRVVNLTPGAPAIDLVDQSRGALVSGVVFKTEKLQTLRAGSYTLSLNQSGTSNELAYYGSVRLQSRVSYTVYYLPEPSAAAAAKAVKPGKRVLIKTFGK